MTEAEAERPWLTLSEAAARSGQHIDALRAQLRRGRLEARKGNRGEWLVRMPGAEAEAGRGIALGNGRGEAEALAALREEVAELRVALARAEAGAEAGAAQAEAKAEARAARAEAETAAQRELVVELKRLLEAAQRPFWQRWLKS